ncbi:MAG: Smr/MutS family protein [bacterium]
MSRKRKNKRRTTSKEAGLKIAHPSLPRKSHVPRKQYEGTCEEDARLFLEAIESLKDFQGDLIAEKFDSCAPSATMIRHKKKAQESQKHIKTTTLDLHGFSRTEAIARLENFCRLSARQGLSTLTVITGRGIHSRSRKSVLKQEIIRWLDSGNGRKLVESYRPGFPHQGGEGVFILYLHHHRL